MSEIIYDEEDGRIGCCWVKTEQNIWIRRNSTVACDSCRKKRIRCTSSIYGAPCPDCIKAQISCHIPQCGDPFSFSDKPIFVFRNIYPAPAAPISTTLNNVSKYQLDLQAVNARILVSGDRPAPLIWKSIEPVALTSKKRKGESTPIQQTKRRGIDDIKAPSNAIAKIR